MSDELVIEGKKVSLRKLRPQDLNETYLGWLNDPEVLRFSGRKGTKSTMESLQKFYQDSLTSSDLILAICLKPSQKHIGNISLNSIKKLHRSAELSIMVGDKSQWGQGVGGEAIKVLTDHAFKVLKLHRVWAESPNPGFNKAVSRLGWQKEGVKREAFELDGRMVDFECYSILRPEWERQN